MVRVCNRAAAMGPPISLTLGEQIKKIPSGSANHQLYTYVNKYVKKLKANGFQVLYFNKVKLLVCHCMKHSYILPYGSVTCQLHANIKHNVKIYY